MRLSMILCALALLAGCANRPIAAGNPNRAVTTPLYMEPGTSSLGLGYRPMALDRRHQGPDPNRRRSRQGARAVARISGRYSKCIVS
jgi:hypothetical protein